MVASMELVIFVSFVRAEIDGSGRSAGRALRQLQKTPLGVMLVRWFSKVFVKGEKGAKGL
jgi:hypothetical protein